MLEKARQNIEQYAFGKKVAAAVSGGEDSMALLVLLLPYHKAGKLSLCVVNVDHCLRARSSDDSAFVRDFCEKNGVPFIGERIDIPARQKQSGRGAEAEAHFARKEFFARVLQSGTADMVATAHHARDNAETVLLHLFRGCGVKGLSGMQVLSNALFRPFITTSKEEISEFVAANAVPFVTDETNADIAYDRNYIRHEILPRIRTRFPDFERAVCRAAQNATQAYAALCDGVDESAFTVRGDAVLLREDKLSAPYIFAALEKCGQSADVYATDIQSVQNLMACKPCARVRLGGGITAAREYGHIAFYCAEDAQKNGREIPFFLPDGTVAVSEDVTVERIEDIELPPPRGKLYINADAVPEGSVWRYRRDGDTFKPYGGGRKKLKEYFIDKKIPLRLRDRILLLCHGSEVLAVAGYEISDGVKVTDKSANIVCLRTKGEDGCNA